MFIFKGSECSTYLNATLLLFYKIMACLLNLLRFSVVSYIRAFIAGVTDDSGHFLDLSSFNYSKSQIKFPISIMCHPDYETSA